MAMLKVKVPHMKIVNDQKGEKMNNQKIKKKSGRYTLVVEEKLRMKEKEIGGQNCGFG